MAAAQAHALVRQLLSEGRDEEAVEVWRDRVRAEPDDPYAHYGLASVLYAIGREDEAEAACREAMAKGLDGVEPWLFLARLMTLQARFGEAEDALREAVARDALSEDAQRDLANLIWMRTGDVVQACALLDAAPPTAGLTALTVKLLQDAGEHEKAYALAADRARRGDPSLHLLAARAAVRADPAACDRHLAQVPPWVNPRARAKGEIEADLALGRGAEAARRAEALSAAHPDDHYVTALKASAWRLAGDSRARELYDYDRLIRTYRIEPPDGWTSLDAYLADLERALDRLHPPLTHPIGQSLRGGSQTQRSLLDYPDPEIQALFQALAAPIRRHIEAVGGGGGYDFAGAWSVRLNPHGRHADHVHPEGWLSSAFYVRLPEMRGREGWLKFGEPGTPTSPRLEPGHWVKPEPGLLVLFPSYMWHGTEPFSSAGTRLTCAFDLVRG
jgi:tetratricopeptide (TPR) repeat protein